MNEATNEQLDRYLFGEMNTAEQQHFLADAASNPELGRTIATEQRIEGVLRADRDAVPNNHAIIRQKMLALAAATPVAQHAAGSGITGSQAGGWFGKMIVGSVAAIGVAGGIIWLSSGNNGNDQQTVAPVPAVQPLPSPAVAPPQFQQQAPVAPVIIENPSPAATSGQPVNGRATAESSTRKKTSRQQPTAKTQKNQLPKSAPPIVQGANSKSPRGNVLTPNQP